MKSLGRKVTVFQDTGDTRQRRSSKNVSSKQATDDSPVKKFTFEKIEDENPRAYRCLCERFLSLSYALSPN